MVLTGDKQTAKLIDFDISRHLDQATHQSTTGLRGTIAYMAPEIVKEDHYGKESDMWYIHLMKMLLNLVKMS